MCPSKKNYQKVVPEHFNHKLAPVPPHTQRSNIFGTIGACIGKYMLKHSCLCQSILSVFIVLGIYRSGNLAIMCRFVMRGAIS